MCFSRKCRIVDNSYSGWINLRCAKYFKRFSSLSVPVCENKTFITPIFILLYFLVPFIAWFPWCVHRLTNEQFVLLWFSCLHSAVFMASMCVTTQKIQMHAQFEHAKDSLNRAKKVKKVCLRAQCMHKIDNKLAKNSSCLCHFSHAWNNKTNKKRGRRTKIINFSLCIPWIAKSSWQKMQKIAMKLRFTKRIRIFIVIHINSRLLLYAQRINVCAVCAWTHKLNRGN